MKKPILKQLLKKYKLALSYCIMLYLDIKHCILFKSSTWYLLRRDSFEIQELIKQTL